MLFDKSECGWLIDAATLGKTRGWLMFLTKSERLPPSLREEVKLLVGELEKIECAFYTKS